MRVYFLLYYTLWYSFRSSRLQVQQEQPTLFVFENGTLFASETDCRIDDCQRWQEWHFCFIARLEKDERDEREKYKCGAHFHTRTAHSMLPPESTLCVCMCVCVMLFSTTQFGTDVTPLSSSVCSFNVPRFVANQYRTEVPCPVSCVPSDVFPYGWTLVRKCALYFTILHIDMYLFSVVRVFTFSFDDKVARSTDTFVHRVVQLLLGLFSIFSRFCIRRRSRCWSFSDITWPESRQVRHWMIL